MFSIILSSLIPFGLHEESNRLVDVASVEGGRKCMCVCPSCLTPLIARKGNVKEWHFAYHSRNVKMKTKEKCEDSFAVPI